MTVVVRPDETAVGDALVLRVVILIPLPESEMSMVYNKNWLTSQSTGDGAHLVVGETRELVRVEVAEVALFTAKIIVRGSAQADGHTGSLENTGPSTTRFTMNELFFCKMLVVNLHGSDGGGGTSTNAEQEPLEIGRHVEVDCVVAAANFGRRRAGQPHQT